MCDAMLTQQQVLCSWSTNFRDDRMRSQPHDRVMRIGEHAGVGYRKAHAIRDGNRRVEREA